MDSKILEIREELLDKWSNAKCTLDIMVDTKISEVSYWEYASDEYYSHLPEDERKINKTKKGKILKNIDFENRFKKREIHSFGFNKKGQLIVMQYPEVDNNIALGTGTYLYDINSDGSVISYVIRWYPKGNFPNTLLAVHEFKSLDVHTWVNVIVSEKGVWSAKKYIYNNNKKIEKVISCNSSNETSWDYEFFYDEEDVLEKIMIGNAVWWKRKKK